MSLHLQKRMFPDLRSLSCLLLLIASLLLMGQPAMAQEVKSTIAAGEDKNSDALRVRRVLILHSFGRNFAPFTAVSSISAIGAVCRKVL